AAKWIFLDDPIPVLSSRESLRRRNHREQMRRMAPKLRQACNGAEMLSADAPSFTVSSSICPSLMTPVKRLYDGCRDHFISITNLYS
ncbi:hypothetical protein F2P79_001614, partial [Pimephales promelas]